MSLHARNTTDKPVIRTLCLAGSGDILHWFSLQIDRLVPIYSHILDKLEGIHVLLVILREIGSHLQWTVHRYIKCQLTADGRVAM